MPIASSRICPNCENLGVTFWEDDTVSCETCLADLSGEYGERLVPIDPTMDYAWEDDRDWDDFDDEPYDRL